MILASIESEEVENVTINVMTNEVSMEHDSRICKTLIKVR